MKVYKILTGILLKIMPVPELQPGRRKSQDCFSGIFTKTNNSYRTWTKIWTFCPDWKTMKLIKLHIENRELLELTKTAFLCS